MTDRTPQHVAIIMDGNGRWAQAQGKPRTWGHQAGVKAVKAVIQAAIESNVPYLTMFVFSQDNWARPKAEVNFLMKLLTQSIERERDFFMKQNVRFRLLGDMANVEPPLAAKLMDLVSATEHHQGLTLVFAFNYTGQWDITQACQRLVDDAVAGRMTADAVNQGVVSRCLMTGEYPDLDLLIRTSGEMRLSNFLLWSAAYAELYFSDKFWPDFTADDFKEALQVFAKRERRFGGLLVQAEP